MNKIVDVQLDDILRTLNQLNYLAMTAPDFGTKRIDSFRKDYWHIVELVKTVRNLTNK